MRTRLAAIAALLVAVCTACTSTPTPTAPAPSRRAQSPTRDQTDLVASLRRTQAAPHRFAVDADLPKGQHLRGTGSFDAAKLLYASSTELGDPKSGLDRIATGTDYYQRAPGAGWVHVDLRRLTEQSALHFATADATGLVQFAGAITEARRTGPGTYTGRFRPDTEDVTEPFLPLGTPSVRSVGMRVSPFTVTLDARGWVTSIAVELTPTNSPTLHMDVALSAHGKPVDVERPDAQEADDTLYR